MLNFYLKFTLYEQSKPLLGGFNNRKEVFKSKNGIEKIISIFKIKLF